MRAWIVIALVTLIALALLSPAQALAASPRVTLAQQDDQAEEEEAQGEEEGGTTKDAPEESGAGEGETEGAAEEEGPLWTYQMARIALLGLFPLLLAVGFWYYRFVASRAREG